jgi:hypothetical protein
MSNPALSTLDKAMIEAGEGAPQLTPAGFIPTPPALINGDLSGFADGGDWSDIHLGARGNPFAADEALAALKAALKPAPRPLIIRAPAPPPSRPQRLKASWRAGLFSLGFGGKQTLATLLAMTSTPFGITVSALIVLTLTSAYLWAYA